MKIVKTKNSELVAENEFSKHFKVGETELFLAKAVDDETDKHYMVISIPKIVEVSATDIQYPFEFETAEERDFQFNDFGLDSAENLLADIVAFIKLKEQERQMKENQIQPENN